MSTKATRNVISKGNVRPLGAVKHNTGNDKIPKLPSFSKNVERNKMENVGVLGNAMNVPPSKTREEPKQKTQSAKSDSSSSSRSLDNMVDKKELQEAKVSLLLYIINSLNFIFMNPSLFVFMLFFFNSHIKKGVLSCIQCL